MIKGQSLVVQFVIFFLIGFAVYLMVSGFFNYQSELYRQDIVDSGVNLTASQLSSAVISLVEGCKACDQINMTLNMRNFTANYPLEIDFSSSGFKMFVPVVEQTFESPIHNINSYLTIIDSVVLSTRPINLMFDKTQNKLEAE